MKWTKVSDAPPPFGKKILAVIGAFPGADTEHCEIVSCIVVKESPNDTDPRSEYAEFVSGKWGYNDFQFFLVSPDSYYALPIDTSLHGEDLFMGWYSDSISHWAPVPDLPAR